MAVKRPRELSKNGFRGELIGATTSMQLWINGSLYMKGIRGYGKARRIFESYATRRAA